MFTSDRLLNCILCDEEQADCTEASLNIHLQYYMKNVRNIQNDFKRVMEKINHCEDDIGLLQQADQSRDIQLSHLGEDEGDGDEDGGVD